MVTKNILTEFQRHIKLLLSDMGLEGFDNVTVEFPRDPKYGDLATNAAMVMCKKAGIPPQELAGILANKLEDHIEVTEVNVAGPGFINFFLNKDIWGEQLGMILAAGQDYGKSDIGAGERINIEYVSTNPTGPLHVGHVRGAVLGDVLANLLDTVGFKAWKEYYVNDAGTQIELFAESVYLRYTELNGHDITGSWHDDLYPGEYVTDLAKQFHAEFADDNEDNYFERSLQALCVKEMLKVIREDLKALGVEHHSFIHETDLIKTGEVDKAHALLKKKKLLYTGVLEAPLGQEDEDYDPRPQLLFKSTKFGDDKDRPLQKEDESWTYFATDIANHHSKINRKFSRLINIWGADHGGYVKRVEAAVEAMSDGKCQIDTLLCQMVRLIENGEVLKMSKRDGNFVTLRELLNDVGKDVIRFTMITKKPETQLDFDLDIARQQVKENPVWYVQYAHARSRSALAHAETIFPGLTLEDADLTQLVHESEIEVIKKLTEWPKLVEGAALAYEPHRIAFYLQDLAKTLHGYWHVGNKDKELRFIIEDNQGLSKARLALVQGVATVIANGLNILGIQPLNKM